MKFSELMTYFDYKKTKIARAVGISRQAVSRWHKNDAIPWYMQCEIQILTNNKLLASKDHCSEYEKRRFKKCHA